LSIQSKLTEEGTLKERLDASLAADRVQSEEAVATLKTQLTEAKKGLRESEAKATEFAKEYGKEFYLRKQIAVKLEAGQSKQEILDFMVSRYGDFVLYRPEFNARTLLLWIGPFVLLVVAVGVLGGALSVHEIEASVVVSPVYVQSLAQAMLGYLHFARMEELSVGSLLLLGVTAGALCVGGAVVSVTRGVTGRG
jgi:hypothetical protein